jgi:hypothetical protein
VGFLEQLLAADGAGLLAGFVALGGFLAGGEVEFQGDLGADAACAPERGQQIFNPPGVAVFQAAGVFQLVEIEAGAVCRVRV